MIHTRQFAKAPNPPTHEQKESWPWLSPAQFVKIVANDKEYITTKGNRVHLGRCIEQSSVEYREALNEIKNSKSRDQLLLATAKRDTAQYQMERHRNYARKICIKHCISGEAVSYGYEGRPINLSIIQPTDWITGSFSWDDEILSIDNIKFYKVKFLWPSMMNEKSMGEFLADLDLHKIQAETFNYATNSTTIPADEMAASSTAQPNEPTIDKKAPAGGFAGRPSHKAALIAEMKRRHSHGDLASSLAEEARYLLSWGQREFPDSPYMPGKSPAIENAIRTEYRALNPIK